MPASVNRSSAKHYESNTITEYVEFEGRSHWTCGEPGWEAIADHALEWALARATGAEIELATPAEKSGRRPRPACSPAHNRATLESCR